MTRAEVEIPRRAVVRLVRFGFEDGERAARLLSDPDLGLWDLWPDPATLAGGAVVVLSCVMSERARRPGPAPAGAVARP